MRATRHLSFLENQMGRRQFARSVTLFERFLEKLI
jgi:hypothetical protein